MKRFFALCSFLIFMFTCSSVSAIEFHGIPWEISVNELADALKERGIPVNPDDIKSDANMAIWSNNFRNSFYDDIEATGYKIMLNFWADDEKPSIAGYPVRIMEFYAHYDITGGILKQGADDSHYYMAQIWFDVNDAKTPSVYDDLFNKLTELYGNGIEDSVFIVDTTYTYTVWNGTDDTAVCLFRSESTSSDYQFLNLWYGHTNIKDTLEKIRNLVIETDVNDASNDLTGL